MQDWNDMTFCSNNKLLKIPISLTDINTCEDLPVLLEWFRARDVFLGSNNQERSFSRGIALATCCLHKDAKWLVEVVTRNGMPANLLDARNMFQAEREDDPLALCFAALLGWRFDFELLCKAAHLGCALAQGSLAFGFFYLHFGPPNYVRARFWAEQAAAQLEPQGFFVLGQCYDRGVGVAMNKAKSLEVLKQAAELGYVDAFHCCATFYRSDEPEFFFWLGKFCYCARGYLQEKEAVAFLAEAMKRIRDLVRNPELGSVVFQIGASLQGHVLADRHTVFGRSESEIRYAAAVRAVGMHEIWCKKARVAVETWSVVAMRYSVCKDIRLKIARLIWESRKEALHLNELQWDTTRVFDRKLMKVLGLLGTPN
jgi:hypothetical protein